MTVKDVWGEVNVRKTNLQVVSIAADYSKGDIVIYMVTY